MFFSFIRIIITLLVVFSGMQIAAQPENISASCQTFINKLKKDHPNYRFGWVQVPENWFDQEKSKKINVFYYTNYKPGMVPLVYFNGGPLSSSWATMNFLPAIAGPRNIGPINLDQRGTGCSDPVPQGSDLETTLRASLYSTDHIVRDAEKIRTTLNIKKWKIFGQSYGVTIVNRYLMDSPNSVISAHGYSATVTNNFRDFFYFRMLAQFNITDAFKKGEPALYQKYVAAKKMLDETRMCYEHENGKVCGSAILDGLFMSMSGLPNQISEGSGLVELFQDKDGNTTDTLNFEKAKEFASYSINAFFGPGALAYDVIWKNENSSLSPYSDARVDCAAAEKIFQYVRKTSTDEILFSECRLLKAIFDNTYVQRNFELLAKIPGRKNIDFDLIVKNLKANKHIKYYLYGAGMDGISGFDPTKEFSLKAPKSIHFEYLPAYGHGGYKFNKLVWDHVSPLNVN